MKKIIALFFIWIILFTAINISRAEELPILYSPNGKRVVILKEPLDIKISRIPLKMLNFIAVYSVAIFSPHVLGGMTGVCVPNRVYIRNIDKRKSKRYPFEGGCCFVWSPDSKKLFIGNHERPAIIYVDEGKIVYIGKRKDYLKTKLPYAIETAQWGIDSNSIIFKQWENFFLYAINKGKIEEVSREYVINNKLMELFYSLIITNSGDGLGYLCDKSIININEREKFKVELYLLNAAILESFYKYFRVDADNMLEFRNFITKKIIENNLTLNITSEYIKYKLDTYNELIKNNWKSGKWPSWGEMNETLTELCLERKSKELKTPFALSIICHKTYNDINYLISSCYPGKITYDYQGN